MITKKEIIYHETSCNLRLQKCHHDGMGSPGADRRMHTLRGAHGL